MDNSALIAAALPEVPALPETDRCRASRKPFAKNMLLSFLLPTYAHFVRQMFQCARTTRLTKASRVATLDAVFMLVYALALPVHGALADGNLSSFHVAYATCALLGTAATAAVALRLFASEDSSDEAFVIVLALWATHAGVSAALWPLAYGAAMRDIDAASFPARWKRRVAVVWSLNGQLGDILGCVVAAAPTRIVGPLFWRVVAAASIPLLTTLCVHRVGEERPRATVDTLASDTVAMEPCGASTADANPVPPTQVRLLWIAYAACSSSIKILTYSLSNWLPYRAPSAYLAYAATGFAGTLCASIGERAQISLRIAGGAVLALGAASAWHAAPFTAVVLLGLCTSYIETSFQILATARAAELCTRQKAYATTSAFLDCIGTLVCALVQWTVCARAGSLPTLTMCSVVVIATACCAMHRLERV